MIKTQVLAVRDHMFSMVYEHSNNPIVLHLANAALDGFVQVNLENDAYATEVDIHQAAKVEISRCLDAAIKSRDVWILSISSEEVAKWGPDYFVVLSAYEELKRIMLEILKCRVSY